MVSEWPIFRCMLLVSHCILCKTFYVDINIYRKYILLLLRFLVGSYKKTLPYEHLYISITHTLQQSSCQSTASHDIYRKHLVSRGLRWGRLHMSNRDNEHGSHIPSPPQDFSPVSKLLAFDMLKSTVAEKTM